MFFNIDFTDRRVRSFSFETYLQQCLGPLSCPQELEIVFDVLNPICVSQFCVGEI